MIANIINKEAVTADPTINICMSRHESQYCKNYFKEIFPKSFVVDFEDSYYGNMEPTIIICNNRLTHLEKSIELAKFFHTPLIIIDHDTKPELVTNQTKSEFLISPVSQIALSKDIYFSWNKIHDDIIDLALENKPKWKNIMYNMCKQSFKIKINKIK
jgi:hypothetical protein